MSVLPAALAALDSIILGKARALRLALSCLIARGHLLIEDVPGVGKTTMAHALAQVLGLSWQRVQFTSDLLPADILGVSVFDRATQRFEFRPGPIFTQLLLADEVNRASPRTQSALLEAMQEHQVSMDGVTHALPEPFFVVATQNPHEQLGTYALPESQLDRFLMRIEIGYPDPRHERMLLTEGDRRSLLEHTSPILTTEELLALQRQVAGIHLASPLLDYVQQLVRNTRARSDLRLGLSPRAAQGLVRAAQAWALIDGRDAVLPDDVQAVWPAVALHRLEPRNAADRTAAQRELLLRAILESVPVPR
jgi:MoxR-like ATPase